jgi:hypothetical protein
MKCHMKKEVSLPHPVCLSYKLNYRTKLRGESPRANYVDWANAVFGEVSANFCG